MRNYIIKRLLLLIPTFLVVSMIIFVLMRAIPGDAAIMMLRPGESGEAIYGPEAYAALRHQFGLDKPLWEQYTIWLWGIMRGDWGRSLYSNTPVLTELFNRLPVTVELAFLTVLIAFSIAIPIGVLSAIRQDTLLDYVARLIPIAFLSMPGFWIGTLLILIPAMLWRYLPPLHYISPLEDPITNLRQFLPPALSMGAFSSAVLMRMTRSTMLEVLRQDYVRTAWAKGLWERAVIQRHALKNALIPVVTIAGMQFGHLLGGTVIMEALFGLPGLGRLTLFSIEHRDYPQVQANVVIFAALYVVINLIVDLIYGWLDPRIRYD